MTTLKTPELIQQLIHDKAKEHFKIDGDKTVVTMASEDFVKFMTVLITQSDKYNSQVLCDLLEGEKGRWVAAYMPADEGKDPSKWGFKTEKEAWDFIEKRLTPCPLDPKDKSGKPCDSCMAEWMVYQIPETDQAIEKAQALIRQTLDPISSNER